MISRNRSTSTAAAISIERTTSANSTVTCLYSAASTDATSCDPHSSQNSGASRVARLPHDPHTAAAGVYGTADPAVDPDCQMASAIGATAALRSQLSWVEHVGHADGQLTTRRDAICLRGKR